MFILLRQVFKWFTMLCVNEANNGVPSSFTCIFHMNESLQVLSCNVICLEPEGRYYSVSSEYPGSYRMMYLNICYRLLMIGVSNAVID